MRGRVWLSGAVAVGVAAIAALAVMDAARSDPAGRDPPRDAARTEGPRLAGPDVPAAGVLPGRLVLLTGPDCRVRVLDFAALELGASGPATACRLWASPRGDLVAFLRRGGEAPRLLLASVGEPPTVGGDLGPVASAPAWGPDGDRLAVCRPDGSTVVVRVDGAELERLAGCHPRFAPDGNVVTSPAAFAETADGRGHVVGSSFAPDGADALVTASPAAQFGFELVLELSRDGIAKSAFDVPAYGPTTGLFGVQIQFAPGGDEVALTTPAVLTPRRPEDLVGVLDLRSGRTVEGLTDVGFTGLAWSPDGAWLALSTGNEVLVYGPARTDPVYVLPVRAQAIGWLRAQPRPGTRPRRRRRAASPRPPRTRAGAGSRT